MDWYSNLRWLTLWIPRVEDHYDQTEQITPKLVQYIKDHHGTDIRIMAAGHSLGGGLAQTAAYAACGRIDTVFAFDSSPVTKHSAANRCPQGSSVENVYRFFEQSEALSYVRFLLRMALGLKHAAPHMREIKVHLFSGFGVRAHNMSELAVKLDAAIKASHTPVRE